MGRDQIFGTQHTTERDFVFDGETASVFDDMVSRSVPFYGEMQRMVSEIAADFAVEGTNLYDIGCSTCTTFLALDGAVRPGVKFIGIDNSTEMLNKGREKLGQANFARPYELIEADMNKGVMVENASVVVMLLTLQFVRPLYRQQVIKSILDGMTDSGCLILVEKLVSADTLFNRLFINYYYEMKKRNDYSELEVSQKRAALENVLVPYRFEENRELLLGSGFTHFEECFRWYNFCGMIAVKGKTQ